jgi:membrane protease YdiL (CAAX protease family)
MKLIGFLATFGLAWFLLDRLATSPPLPISAILALAAVICVLAVAELVVFGTPRGRVPSALGFGVPRLPAVIVAGAVSAAVVAAYLLGATALGITLTVRPDWLAVLAGAMLFHGVAEELVWRGFVFAHLRQQAPFGLAVVCSVPLIAATHLPILMSSGALIGGLALATAAVTCLPLARLWERSGRTIWPAALLHGSIGTWQVFERTYSPVFAVVVLVASLTVPLLVLAVPARWFAAPARRQSSGVARLTA